MTIRELKFPVTTPPLSEGPPNPRIEYFVLEHNESTNTVRHPTTGREIDANMFYRDLDTWSDWLRGITDKPPLFP